MKVSSSRAPPPKVTTTALRFLGIANARKAVGPKKVAAEAAPVAARRKVRRLREIAWEISLGLRAFRSARRIYSRDALSFMILLMGEHRRVSGQECPGSVSLRQCARRSRFVKIV